MPTYPITQPADNAAAYTWTQPIRDGIAAANDHQTRITSLEASGGGSGPVVVAAVTTGNTAAQNSTALNAAITAAGTSGGEVVIPGGTFNHQGFSLPTAGKIHVRGCGRGKTVLVNTHATNASVSAIGPGGTYCERWTLSDLTLDASAVRSTQVGIDILLAVMFSVRDVNIYNHGMGIRNKASWECTFDTVSAYSCTIGWEFPDPTPYTVSCPINVNNGSAIACGTALRVTDSVECMTWCGGDFSASTTGAIFTGNQTRLITITSVNFEGIANDAVTMGDSTTGPTNINFVGCRFFHAALTGGSRAINFVRGTNLAFLGCWWGNFETAIAQSDTNWQLTIIAGGTNNVTNFLNSNGTILGAPDHLISVPGNSLSLNAGGPTVTGAKGGNAALTSLINALTTMGLIENSTT